MARFAKFVAWIYVLSLSPWVQAASPAQPYAGQWLGQISPPGRPPLRLGFELFARADGSPGGNLVSPDQGIFVVTLDKVAVAGSRLELSATWEGIQLVLTGTEQMLSGEYRQGSATLPIELRPVSSFGEPVRPQTPVAPFPYVEEELVVTTPDGVKLSGTFARPRGSARVTAVVLLHGSGP